MWIEIFALREFLCYNLGNTTLGLYRVFVLVELILHTIRQKRLEEQTDDRILPSFYKREDDRHGWCTGLGYR